MFASLRVLVGIGFDISEHMTRAVSFKRLTERAELRYIVKCLL